MSQSERNGARPWLPALVLLFALLPGVRAMDLIDPASGETRSLAFDAAVTHVVFMATWCPPCLEELEPRVQLEQRRKGQGYRLVLIAVKNRQDVGDLRSLAERREVPGTLLFDAEGTVQRRLKTSELPTHILFDRDGNEIARADFLDDSLNQAIADALGN